MESISLITLLQHAHNGDKTAQEEIIVKFMPLIRKYAHKCYSMEFDDAQQELSLALLYAVASIKYIQNERECLRFIENAIINHYKYLCRISMKRKDYEIASDSEVLRNIPQENSFAQTELKLMIQEYLQQLPQRKRHILEYVLSGQFSTAEISKRLHISSQYINRIKKDFLKQTGGFFHEN